MKINKLKIGTQLTLGMGLIIFFAILLSATAWYQSTRIWAQTEGLYRHPLQVRSALSNLQVSIHSISRAMKDIVHISDATQRQDLINQIDIFESQANQQLIVLNERYLGPKNDLKRLSDLLAEWRPIRTETLHLFAGGKTAEAQFRVHPSGTGGVHVEKILNVTKEINNFATNRAELFYTEARLIRNRLLYVFIVLVSSIILLSLYITLRLFRNISSPLKNLLTVSECFRKGDIKARLENQPNNEFGSIAKSFNLLADTLEKDIQHKAMLAEISKSLIATDNTRTFCLEMIGQLLKHTDSYAGAIYLLSLDQIQFDHFESIGLPPSHPQTFDAKNKHGEFGRALASKNIEIITGIPENSGPVLHAVTGTFRPSALMTIPILLGNNITAIISLASAKGYSDSAIKFVRDIHTELSARVNSMLAMKLIQGISDRLEEQNAELEAQKRELQSQKDAMAEQNIELEMQKRQLDESNKLKSSFLSNMSHELRTPLNSVIALSGVLGRRLRDSIGSEEYSYIDIIERNGKSLLSLINDILDLSRIEAGRTDITLEMFSVSRLVDDLVALISPQAQLKEIILTSHLESNLPNIKSDATKVRHILQNLISNAVKFTNAGRVTVTGETRGETLTITVTDTGIGIDASHIPFIFDEFRQADESTTRKYGGSGLGLAIAKKHAEMLGGAITVESFPGKGSSFTLTLPLSLSSSHPLKSQILEPELKTSETPYKEGQKVGSGNILVVEDSEPAIIQIRDILEESGYVVHVAHNGKEAIDKMNNFIPDAMLLDLMMPEVDGFEVLKKIRGIDTLARVPVLILTAKHVTREELSFLKGNNIHQLIRKGDISREELLTAVATMVTQKKAPTPSKKVFTDSPVFLVVEDNPDNQKTAQALLQDSGRVLIASDGQEGVNLALKHRPHLIFMDISLPVMDGFKAYEAIRSHLELSHIPIVALTARAMSDDRQTILDFGFDNYISKPIHMDLLQKVIKEFIHDPI